MKNFLIILINCVSVMMLSYWMFNKCLSVETNFSTLIADFLTLITCFYAMIRIIESKNGKFHVMDMVTIYYASLFFFVLVVYQICLPYLGFYVGNKIRCSRYVYYCGSKYVTTNKFL